jgi:hypothetical protein
MSVTDESDETVGNLSPGEEPPEPEEEGFREEQIQAEKERKLRVAEKLDARSEEAKKWYSGKTDESDAPGAALADGPREDIAAPGSTTQPKSTDERPQITE